MHVSRLALRYLSAQPERIHSNYVNHRGSSSEIFTDAGPLLLHDAVERRNNRRVGKLLPRNLKLGTPLKDQRLPVSNLLDCILITAEGDLVVGLRRFELRSSEHSSLNQRLSALELGLGVVEKRLSLPNRSSFFELYAIVGSVGRQAHTSAPLCKCSLSLLKPKLIILFFDLRDHLTPAHDASEIDRNGSQPARHLRADCSLIVSRERSGYSDRAFHRDLRNRHDLHLARLNT